MKKTIGVVFGGRSGEHEVSIRSAKSLIEHLDQEKYDVIPIAISHDGRWLNTSESANLLPEETRKLVDGNSERFGSEEIAIVANETFTRSQIAGGSSEGNKASQIDVAFPVLHGTYGEDGTVQGLFEMAGIPYVGCGVLASACGMDKVVMKTLFGTAQLPICRYVWFLRSEWEHAGDNVIDSIKARLGFPCFVKPANLGSSVGVSRATDEESLRKAISLAAEYDRKIIVEEAIDAREIECGVIGNDEPMASLPGEYVVHDPNKKFLDYTEKYAGTGNNEFIVPALVSEELTKKIQEMAVVAFKAIDGSGLARVDFFLRNDTGALLVNEINTLPGLTDASGFPKMWAGSGMSFGQIADQLIELAISRHLDRQRNKTEK
jgi:D-alanine-D-alanine ligase